MKKRILLAIIAVILLTAFDQIVKYAISSSFVVGETKKIIGRISTELCAKPGCCMGKFFW